MKKFIAGLIVSGMLYCSASLASAIAPPPAVGAGAVLVVGYLLFHKKSEKPVEKKIEKKGKEKKAAPKAAPKTAPKAPAKTEPKADKKPGTSK